MTLSGARQRLRCDGQDRFAAVGLPSRKVESWHYTDLSQTDLDSYSLAEPAAPVAASEAGVIHLRNGFLVGQGPLPDGVSLERLDSAGDAAALGSLLSPVDRPLVALNGSRFNDALLIRVAAGAQPDRPVHILSEAVTQGAREQFHGRLLLVIEPGATLTLIETHRGEGDYFSNSVAEILIGEGAMLRHVTLQDQSPLALHVASIGIDLAASAGYHGVLLQLGARLARHDLEAHLGGRLAEFSLDGASLALQQQHLDTTTRVIHRAPSCLSRQLVKTVLDHEGHGVFQGTVLVERGAQKTRAHQLSRALMLSDRAAMDNKPELEIFADDVKCGHGATIGDIDADALFYLQARGLDAAVARRLLTEAFLTEVVEQIAEPSLRQQLGDLLRHRLNGLTSL